MIKILHSILTALLVISLVIFVTPLVDAINSSQFCKKDCTDENCKENEMPICLIKEIKGAKVNQCFCYDVGYQPCTAEQINQCVHRTSCPTSRIVSCTPYFTENKGNIDLKCSCKNTSIPYDSVDKSCEKVMTLDLEKNIIVKYIGSVGTIKCNDGFVKTGEYLSINCKNKKRFFPNKAGDGLIEKEESNKDITFKCIQPKCNGRNAQIPQNAMFSHENEKNSYEVVCKPGYYAVNNRRRSVTLTCKKKGWEFDLKTLLCVKEPKCPQPKPIEGGVIYGCRPDYYEDVGKGVNSTCFVKCDEEHEYVNSRKLACDFNGGWRGTEGDESLPICKFHATVHECWNKKCGTEFAKTCDTLNKKVSCDYESDHLSEESCVCSDKPNVDYTPDLYLSPPKCPHCAKIGIPCAPREFYTCKDGNLLNFDDCKCTPKRMHGRCSRLKRILLKQHRKDDFATPAELFTGNATCTTNPITQTLKCHLSCPNGQINLVNYTSIRCDFYGVIKGSIPVCEDKECHGYHRGTEGKCDQKVCARVGTEKNRCFPPGSESNALKCYCECGENRHIAFMNECEAMKCPAGKHGQCRHLNANNYMAKICNCV